MRLPKIKIKKVSSMRISKILLYIILFFIILFMSLVGCNFLSSKEEGKPEEVEIGEATEEWTTGKKEVRDTEEYVITKSEYFEMPDEIILYNKGEQIIVKKNTDLYNKIVYITNERFKKDCGMAEEVISDEFVGDFKNNKFAIEFIYAEEMQTVYTCEGYHFEKNYTKILFPLPDFRAIFGPYEYEHQSGYQQEYQSGPWCISIQPESDYLIEIIEEEFKKR